MPLFRKRPAEPLPPIVCPLCGTELSERNDKTSHWESHLDQIGPGQGDATGQYTWTCECGHCQMKWPGRGAAVQALQYHLHRAHGLPVADESVLMVYDRMPNGRHLRSRLSQA